MSESAPAVLTIRGMRPTDWRLISDAWQRSYRNSPWAGVVPNHLWAGLMLEMQDGLLARGADCAVIVDESRPDLIVGFICTERVAGLEQPVLHYLYVKRDFRGVGIAGDLLRSVYPEDSRVTVTHLTQRGANALKRHRIRMTFAPEIVRRKGS